MSVCVCECVCVCLCVCVYLCVCAHLPPYLFLELPERVRADVIGLLQPLRRSGLELRAGQRVGHRGLGWEIGVGGNEGVAGWGLVMGCRRLERLWPLRRRLLRRRLVRGVGRGVGGASVGSGSRGSGGRTGLPIGFRVRPSRFSLGRCLLGCCGNMRGCTPLYLPRRYNFSRLKALLSLYISIVIIVGY